MSGVLLVAKGLDIGGVERIVTDLAVGVRRHGWRAEVAVVNDRRDRFVPVLREAGVPVHGLGDGDRVGLRAAWRLRRLVRTGSYSVVHAHGPLAAVLCRLVVHDLPVVSTSHTVFSSLHPLTRLAWRLTCRRDAVHLAVSAVVAASMPRRVRERAEVLPHAVDPVAAEAARASRTAPRSGGTVRAVVVARHRGVKNYPNLLCALRDARAAGAPLELVAVGEGPDLEAHRALAAQLGLDGSVHFVAPSIEVLGVIASADFLVVASDYEGQPMVVAEALAVGCPVVSTAVGRVPELVGPDVGRVVPPQRVDLLAAAMTELATDAALRERMSTAALSRAAVSTLDDVVVAHLRLFESLGGRP